MRRVPFELASFLRREVRVDVHRKRRAQHILCATSPWPQASPLIPCPTSQSLLSDIKGSAVMSWTRLTSSKDTS